jgi:hypothetical protein
MKLQSVRIKSNDFPEDQQEFAEALGGILNPFVDKLVIGFNKNFTVDDNLPFEFKTLDTQIDANGVPLNQPDGILNNDDRTIIGNPNPKFTWGFNNDFSYKNFDLNLFFQGSEGNDMLSYTLLELETLSAGNNATTEALRRWTPTNTNTDVPRAFTGRSRRASSRWIFDGSYLRLKNVALGYTLPKSALSQLKIQRMRVFVSAQNLFTSTNYRGFDPEVNYRSSNLNAGVDYASYPNAKSITAGLNIGF